MGEGRGFEFLEMNARSARKANRLKQFDYSKASYYFVNICIQGRVCLLDDFVNGNIILNSAGIMTKYSWQQLLDNYDGVDIDSRQIMANFQHSIIILAKTGHRTHPDTGQPQEVVPTASLSDVFGKITYLTTKKFIDGVKLHQWHSFEKILWQRSFYEHIIRRSENLNRIREYIWNYSLKWALDKDNPNNWAQG